MKLRVCQIGARRTRQGLALYMAVLAVAMIVSLLGLAGLNATSVEREQLNSGNALVAARTNARSAVELALRTINSNVNWRTSYTNGVETTLRSLGTGSTGTVSWILQDS